MPKQWHPTPGGYQDAYFRQGTPAEQPGHKTVDWSREPKSGVGKLVRTQRGKAGRKAMSHWMFAKSDTSLGNLGEISKYNPFTSFARANQAAWGRDVAGGSLKATGSKLGNAADAGPGMGQYQPGPFQRAAAEALQIRRAKRAARKAGRG